MSTLTVQRIAREQYRVIETTELGVFSSVVSPTDLTKIKQLYPAVATMQVGEQVKIERKHKPS